MAIPERKAAFVGAQCKRPRVDQILRQKYITKADITCTLAAFRVVQKLVLQLPLTRIFGAKRLPPFASPTAFPSAAGLTSFSIKHVVTSLKMERRLPSNLFSYLIVSFHVKDSTLSPQRCIVQAPPSDPDRGLSPPALSAAEENSGYDCTR